MKELKFCIGQYYSGPRSDLHIKCNRIITNSPLPQCSKCLTQIYQNSEIINRYENLIRFLKANNSINSIK